MMRVAFLTTDSREHYRDYGNPQPYFGSAPAALLDGFAGLPGLEVHVISCLQESPTSPAKLADNIWYHGVTVPNWGWLKTGYLGCVNAVRRCLKDIGPDLVHGQGTERDCALSAVRSGFPNLITIHGNMRRVAQVNQARPLSYNWIMARLEGWAVGRTGGVLCITEYTRRLVQNETRRTWVVPNAVDAGYFTIHAQPEEGSTVLCVGTVCAHKNQNRMIRELDPIASVTGLTVRFLGGVDESSEYGGEFLKLVEDRAWCQFDGFTDKAGLRKALQQASGLVLPSLEDNCPMVVLESMAAGLPVVAMRVGGVPELVEHQGTGYLCDMGDWTKFRESLKTMLTDRNLRARWGAAGHKRACSLFHPDVVARQHLEVYQDFLKTVS
jgi:glycosyltransferase involved in cell wall biosynthesis